MLKISEYHFINFSNKLDKAMNRRYMMFSKDTHSKLIIKKFYNEYYNTILNLKEKLISLFV